MVATTIAPLALPPTAAPTAATNATSDRTNTCAPRAPTRHTRASGNVWRRWEAGLRWHTTNTQLPQPIQLPPTDTQLPQLPQLPQPIQLPQTRNYHKHHRQHGHRMTCRYLCRFILP